MKLKHCFPLAACAAAVFFAGAAQAQQYTAAPVSPWNAEIGYSWMGVHGGDLGLDTNSQALRGIVGYSFHPNIAVEGMAAFGTHGGNDGGVDVKLHSSYGVFLKPKFDWNNFEVFGRLGWARTDVRASALGLSADRTDNDFAWGAGAAYNINPRTYVSVDYMRLDNKHSTRVDGWTLNLGYRF